MKMKMNLGTFVADIASVGLSHSRYDLVDQRHICRVIDLVFPNSDGASIVLDFEAKCVRLGDVCGYEGKINQGQDNIGRKLKCDQILGVGLL